MGYKISLSEVKSFPPKSDLIAPYVKALRGNGLKVGFYFSHLDWSHPDYPTICPKGEKPSPELNEFAYPEENEDYDGELVRYRVGGQTIEANY